MQNDLLRLLNGSFPDCPRKDIWELSSKFLKLEQRLRAQIFNKDYNEITVIKLTGLAGRLSADCAAFAVWTTNSEEYIQKRLATYQHRYENLSEVVRGLEWMADLKRRKREGGFYAD